MDHNKLWNILEVMGIPDHFTYLLTNLYAGQEAAVRTGHQYWTGSKLTKEYVKDVYCHPAYLTSMQITSYKNGLDEAQAGTKIVRRNIKATDMPTIPL